MSKDVAAIFEKAFAALEEGESEKASAGLEAAKRAGVAVDDPRYLHLQGLIAWAEGDIDEAAMLLEQAVDAGPEDPRIYLDAGELLADLDELDGAESVFRRLLERDDLSVETRAEALMLLAQVRLDHMDSDPEEALELLDEVDASLQNDPGYVSLRAAALLNKGDVDPALALLEQAIAREDDVELRYQLGLACRAHGREEQGVAALLAVRAHDLREAGGDSTLPIPSDEIEDLRRRTEDVIDTLPDPILGLVASASIRVQRWIDEAHVRAGVDPRSAIAFEGTPASAEGAGDGELLGIVVFRDVLVDQIDDDDDIADALALGLLEELTRFFKLENLELG
jgi:tetratricopeptide (TPR) repeat protein